MNISVFGWLESVNLSVGVVIVVEIITEKIKASISILQFQMEYIVIS